MTTSRNKSSTAGFQLNDVAASSSFCSASSSSLNLRPCSGSSLNRGTLMTRFHSSALCSIRRNVRKAQLTLGAGAWKVRTLTYPVVLCARRILSSFVADSRRQPLAQYFFVLLVRVSLLSHPINCDE